MRAERRQPVSFVVRFLPLGPYFLLKTSRIQWFVLVPLGIGTLGRRVAPLSVQYTLS